MKYALTLLFLISIYIPTVCHSETVTGDKTLVKNETWKGTTVIAGNLTIPKGIKLTIESGNPGLRIESGSIYVYGELEILSTSADVPVTSTRAFQGIFVIGGSLLFSGTTMTTVCPVVMAWNHAEVILAQSKFVNCELSGVLISTWDNSKLSISGSTFNQNTARTLVEVRASSSLDISNSVFESNTVLNHIQIYGAGTFSSVSDIRIQDAVQSNGVEIFENATAYLEGNTLYKLQRGISIYSGAEVFVNGNTFIENNIGMESYTASSTLSQNIFEEHSEYAVFVSDGYMEAKDNWWGNGTGPMHPVQNIQGGGDDTDGTLNIFPWLLEKPNIKKCCSSIIFFPGIQGSRLYTRGYFLENQLWEPNREADVKKLFFNIYGESISKSIYTKDMISRTNIGYSIGVGDLDVDVYGGLSEYAQRLVKKRIITEWKPFVYDWRYAAEDILSQRKNEWIASVISMAKKSKTKKVILVGHSYGGILAKDLLGALEAEGLGDLVESVVLIGTPELGSFSSIASILHGDGQAIAGGLILSKGTARQFAKNMGSVYDILKRTMKHVEGDILKIYAKKNETPNILNLQNLESGATLLVQDTLSFIFKKGIFANRTIPFAEHNIQIPGVGNEAVYTKIKDVNDSHIQGGHKITNILATSVPTPVGIEYVERCGPQYNLASFSGPQLPVFNVEKTQCTLERSNMYTPEGDGVVPLGDTTKRIGRKVLFDIRAYQDIHSGNVQHQNLASSEPVISVLNDIVLQRSLQFSAAQYMTLPVENTPVPERPRFFWRLKLQAQSLATVETSEGKVEEFKIGESYVKKSELKGVVYEQIGKERFLLLPSAPKKIELTSKDFGVDTVSIDTLELVGGRYQNSLEQPAYFFFGTAVTPGTQSTILFDEVQKPILLIDENSDGVTDATTTAVVATTTVSDPEIEEYSIEDIKRELVILRGRIQSSSIEKKFKERYVLKVNSLLRRIDAYGVENPKKYASVVQKSLASIIEEVQASYRNYRGGMKLQDASTLYTGFFKVYRMFMFLKV